MRTSAIPDVIDALVTQATANLTDVTVSDGTGVTDKAGDFLMIGVEDPDDDGPTVSASSSQVAGPFGTNRPRDEEGTVTCVALSSNGKSDQKAARDSAYAIATAVASMCRADPSLSIAGYPSLIVEYGLNQSLREDQYDNGVVVILMFSVRFRARI